MILQQDVDAAAYQHFDIDVRAVDHWSGLGSTTAWKLLVRFVCDSNDSEAFHLVRSRLDTAAARIVLRVAAEPFYLASAIASDRGGDRASVRCRIEVDVEALSTDRVAVGLRQTSIEVE